MSGGERAPALLIVDDEEDIRRSVGVIADALLPGVPVIMATDAEAAEAAVGSQPVLGVLTDLRMPGRSGIELVQRLREQHPRIRCALMTGFVEENVDGVRLGDLGLVALLRKPFGMSDCHRVMMALMTPL